ncbi:glycoside hydrolase family 73 protein [Paenibacillaceae bacterium WGS1546]|uniref:glycoside hydrolase family 73 protein n=1 Tax=Cohnella sp. WGS1546 TaxID=3366810 RepID=UPI00372D54D3
MATYTKYARDAFIALVAPIVMQVHREGGRLLPSVRIAQSWHETGGKVPSWHNLGGYKVGSGKPTLWWDGSSVNTATKEVYGGKEVLTRANWRAYKSIYHYYKDQDLLFDLSRYTRVRAAKTPDEQCHMLQACGYATDPKYATKLINAINSYGLRKYDALGASEDGGEDELKLTKNEKTMLVNALNKMAAAGTIEKSWAEKVEKDQLTVSQLVWLNTIILARK